MSEKIIVLHPENQPEVDIYPIIKEGSIPNSVIDNQKIKSRTIINSNIALNTLKYEVLHQTLKDLIDSKITQNNMENYLNSYYYNVEETQQYVGSEINTLHQTIQSEFYSNTTIDNMLMEKTDLSLFRQYLPSTYLNLDKQQDNQTSKLNIHANGSIFLTNSGNKTNSGNYYLPNSIVKTEDAPNGYFVLSTTNDDYQSLYNLGYYDKIVTNDDGTYTITRQTGYHNISNDLIEHGYYRTTQGSHGEYGGDVGIHNLPIVSEQKSFIDNLLAVRETGEIYRGLIGIAITRDGGCWMNLGDNYNSKEKYVAYLSQNNIYIQYKLATPYTEKVEKNHFARYNERFILEHNKSEAERSANLFNTNNYVNNLTINAGTPKFFSWNGSITVWLKLKPNITYTFANYNSSVNLFIALSNAIPSTSTTCNTNGIAVTNNQSKTFTTTSEYYYLAVTSNSTSLTINDYTNFMLNEGTEPLPYQPYEGKTIHEKDLENSLKTKQDKLVSGTNIKKINGNDILGSGNITLTADSVFTKVEDNVTSLTISKNETYLITTIENYEIYVVGKESINFYGSALVTTTGMLDGNPHININGVSHSLSSNTVTLFSGGLFKAYKLSY